MCLKSYTEGGNNINTITEDIAKAIRRKRADLSLTKKETCKAIGISFTTYKRLEQGNYMVKNNIYQKITQWLAKDY
ncbi:transcriptional regulator [Lactococcus formosensis]|nr:transcriptional regulator [Lactococcus formosensis]BDX25712.1 transcriptional regulator [Lactococcus formosensis]